MNSKWKHARSSRCTWPWRQFWSTAFIGFNNENNVPCLPVSCATSKLLHLFPLKYYAPKSLSLGPPPPRPPVFRLSCVQNFLYFYFQEDFISAYTHEKLEVFGIFIPHVLSSPSFTKIPVWGVCIYISSAQLHRLHDTPRIQELLYLVWIVLSDTRYRQRHHLQAVIWPWSMYT